MKILILCNGNSCRSQMAHGFLKAFDQKLIVCSAGIRPKGRLNEKAIEVMKEVGIDISNHTSDPVEKYLDQEWDFVITVCESAKESCPYFNGKVVHRLHMDFDDPSLSDGSEEDILNQFRRVRDEIYKTFYDFYNEQIIPRLSPDEIFSQMLEEYTILPPPPFKGKKYKMRKEKV